ncbi:hypothetical protein BYT27DRAFT_7339244 [Phlegmacium glaucopus]|nr:hypothetical protein BYT27DRAFT_7339244 [Phlegmacium glaucopus]
MTRLTGPQSLVKTISLLGGPPLESTDIDWATDLPAGNAFFEWLADQLHDWNIPNPNLEQNVTSGNGVDDNEEQIEIKMRAALRDVALEKDEVLILGHESLSRDASNDISDSDYLPLSRLKQQAGYINNETELLKRETGLLSTRLVMTKKASQKLTQAIKSLQRTLDEVKSDTNDTEEKLSELSVNADTTIATTLTNAKALVHTLNISYPDDDANAIIETNVVEKSDHDKNITNEHARSSLAQAQTSLTAIIADLREHTERLSLIRKEEAFKNEDIQMEADRLKAAFKSMKSGPTNHILTKNPELEDICALLEHEATSRERGAAPTNLLQSILQELDGQDDDSEVFLEPSALDVDAEISHARCLDQIAILRTYETGLDQALESLDVVLTPLERLHTSLAKVWHCIQEAEALLEAFGDELEDIDMNFVNESLGTKNDSHEVQSKEPGYNDPSSVTSLHEDILTEHLVRNKRLAVMETSEKAWIETLIREYSARPIHPSLSKIYANSPLTTSAPFAFPTQVQQIEAQARDRAMRLEGFVRKLEVKVHETFTKNGPTAKRLDSFVERWCGSMPK